MSDPATHATTLFGLAAVRAAVREVDADATRDAELVRLANGISALIERETRRIFVTRAFTEVRDGDGGHQLFLYQRPITTFTSLTIRRWPTDTTPETITSDRYQVNLETGLVHLWADTLTRGVANVTAAYSAGYGAQDGTTLPLDLYQAGLDLVAHVWQQAKAGGLAAQTVTMANGQTFVPRERWPLHVQRAIDDWTRRGW